MALIGKLKNEAASSLKEREHISASKTGTIAHQQTLVCYCRTVTVRPLLRFLTISSVLELHFKQDGSCW